MSFLLVVILAVVAFSLFSAAVCYLLCRVNAGDDDDTDG